MVPNPLGNEGIDMRRELGDQARTSLTSELAEGGHNRDAAPDALRAIAVVGKPPDILLDLWPDPRCTDAVDRCWLDKVPLQHEQLPFST
jgi:hypothetical protein